VSKSNLKPDAIPFNFETVFEISEIQAYCNDFWIAQDAANKEQGLTVTREEFERGPSSKPHDTKWHAYRQLLEDLYRREIVESTYPDTDVIMLGDFSIEEAGTELLMFGQAYLIPDFKFSERVIQKLSSREMSVKHRTVSQQEIDQSVNKVLESLLANHSLEREKIHPFGAEVQIEEGDLVLATIRPTINGEIWKVGVLDRGKMRIVRGGLHPEAFREQLIGKTVGSHNVSFVLDSKFGSDEGSTVETTVTIHAILSYVLPDWTNDLAQKFGSETVDQLKATVRAKCESNLKQHWEASVVTELFPQIMDNSECGVIPMAMILTKTKELLDNWLKRSKVEDLYKAYNVASERELIARLKLEVQDELSHYVLMWNLGKVLGVERKKEESLGNSKAYMQRVTSKVASLVEVVS